MDSWERFDEKLLPDRKAFCSNLNMEDITNVDYRLAKKAFKTFNNKNLADYHDLHVQSETLLLANACENFRNKFIETYELDSAHFLSVPGLAWQACFKKTQIELELLTDIDMLLMPEKVIKGDIFHGTHRYAKANNKYMKIMTKTKNHHIFSI